MLVTDAVRQYVSGALRGLWKSPAFAVAALMTLSLGIGAALHALQLAIEACVEIATHICAADALGPPRMPKPSSS
jgi:uncharacterized protein YutE (UPF0331/DUF86 family)